MYLVTCCGNWEMCECWGVLGGVVVPHTLAAPEAGAGGDVGSFSLASTCPCLPVRNPLYTLTRNLDLEALTRETAGGAGFTAWQGAARETRHLTNLETTTAATANARLHQVRILCWLLGTPAQVVSVRCSSVVVWFWSPWRHTP